MIGRGERHEKKRKRKEEQGINRETGRTKRRTPLAPENGPLQELKSTAIRENHRAHLRSFCQRDALR